MTGVLAPAGVSVQELPITFDCEGSQLVGMVHLPAEIRGRGLLCLVAGGPQYRGGFCRMQLKLARELAVLGIPVMRFDYRGLGDSEGEFPGFTGTTQDISAALQAFAQHAPGLREVVFWGGCDAASATMINAWRFPQVTGVVVANPWVHSQDSGDAVAVQHFSRRMRDADFWLKLVRLQYNPLPAAMTLLRAGIKRAGAAVGIAGDKSAAAQDDPDLPFQTRMRIGLSRFQGDMLLLMSGRSLLSQEFDHLVETDPAWQAAMRAPRHVVRHDLPEGDQAFSTQDTREEVDRITRLWMQDPHAKLAP